MLIKIIPILVVGAYFERPGKLKPAASGCEAVPGLGPIRTPRAEERRAEVRAAVVRKAN